jgi:malate dehydrogenase (oxaloacetate-decarboxylating)
VIVGAGAAGTAITKLLHLYAKPEIIAIDSKGIVSKNRDDLNDAKQALLKYTNPHNVDGSLEDALAGADVFIGVSKPGLLTAELIGTMAKDPIIFALANPTPEILPDEAKAAGAAVVATGRSDFPNQVNNALAFPGIFRGALDNGVRTITDEHKIKAAEAIAALVATPTAEQIIPSAFDEGLVPAVAAVITS